MLDVVTQAVSNSHEESKETSVVVPLLAKVETYNSSHYEELTTFNVTEWLAENDEKAVEEVEKDEVMV